MRYHLKHRDTGSWDLIDTETGAALMAEETFAVVDGVRDCLMGRCGGCNSELHEVAEAILAKT